MKRYQYVWSVIGLFALAAVGCTDAKSQLPSSATDAEVQQMKADEQRVANEELARQKQGL